jgi:protein-glutamine gamma-glutamyltransferase
VRDSRRVPLPHKEKPGAGGPLHTQEPVTVASFRTWRGWRENVARDRRLTFSILTFANRRPFTAVQLVKIAEAWRKGRELKVSRRALPFPEKIANNSPSIMTAVRSSETISLPLAIERYFEIALYLLVFVGFATLASTGGIDLGSVLFAGSALLYRGYLLATRRTLLIPERWTTLLLLAYGVFYLADYFLISGSFLSPTVHLVLFLTIVRLFSIRRDRDRYFLLIITFPMVLAASVLTVDSTFLLWFAAFVFIAVGTFILMEMRRASARATAHSKESADSRASLRMAFSLAGVTPALSLGILLGATAIFFVLPRISSGYLSAYTPGSEVSTGFSEQVQLGRIGQIQQSGLLVMRIQIDGDKNGTYDLNWRGVALSLFDGRRWSNPHEQRPAPQLPDGRFDIWSSSAGSAGPPHAVRPIHYRVMMEPIGTSVFFMAPLAQTLRGHYRMVDVDGAGAAFDVDGQHPITIYEAWSNIAPPEPSELRSAAGHYPAEVLLHDLQVPRLDPRIPRLAAEITAAADNNYDKAHAIESYLRTRLGYTLELPHTLPRDPLTDFLFERKRGHCEYFASSMAVMLRTLQVPARVVNGFRTTEFNDLTSQYLVRASSAHSWVEVYFPGSGWVSFDPTPASGRPPAGGWNRAALYLDAMASFWREWVIDYDTSHQYSLGMQATQNSRQVVNRLLDWARRRYESLLERARRLNGAVVRSPAPWIIGAILVLVLAVVVSSVPHLWRAVRNWQLAAHPANSPSLSASIWYERVQRLLARRGWRRAPGQTPEEFVGSIEDAAIRKCVRNFTVTYERARFGGSTEDAEHLPGLYDQVSNAAKR